jgi:hypothetical protein
MDNALPSIFLSQKFNVNLENGMKNDTNYDNNNLNGGIAIKVDYDIVKNEDGHGYHRYNKERLE